MFRYLIIVLFLLCFHNFAFCDVSIKLNLLKWVQSRSISIPDLGSGKSTLKSRKSRDNIFYIKTPDGYKPLNIASNKMASILYNGAETFILYSKINGESGESYKEVSKVELPSNVEEIFLLLLQNGTSFRMFPMNVSPKVLPKGKLAVVNITGKYLAISFGGKQAGLPRNAHCILENKDSDTYQDLKIATRKSGKWRLVYSSGISIPKNFRNIVLIYSSTKLGDDMSVDIINLEG